MSLSRRYGIINIAYHGSFHDGKELYTMSNVKRKDSKNRNLRNGESRSEEHTSELQSLLAISYAVFCLKKMTHSKGGA